MRIYGGMSFPKINTASATNAWTEREQRETKSVCVCVCDVDNIGHLAAELIFLFEITWSGIAQEPSTVT